MLFQINLHWVRGFSSHPRLMTPEGEIWLIYWITSTSIDIHSHHVIHSHLFISIKNHHHLWASYMCHPWKHLLSIAKLRRNKKKKLTSLMSQQQRCPMLPGSAPVSPTRCCPAGWPWPHPLAAVRLGPWPSRPWRCSKNDQVMLTHHESFNNGI